MNTPVPPPPLSEASLSELMSANAIVMDIETVANPAALTSCMPVFEGKANTKDPLKIAAQIREKEEKFISQAPLDPNYGMIACICLKNASVEHVFIGDEKKIIQDTWEVLKDWRELVTFNGKSFDQKFLIRRSWYHNIKPTISYDSFPFRTVSHYDIRLILSGGDKTAKGKLATYAKLKLGVDMSASGSEVQEMWDDGKIDEIAAHCLEDVQITWDLFMSLQGFYI